MSTQTEKRNGRSRPMRLILGIATILVGFLMGLTNFAAGQQKKDSNNSISASAFSILRPINRSSSNDQQNAPDRIIPIQPPSASIGLKSSPMPSAYRLLPVVPSAFRRRTQQDFLDDIPPRVESPSPPATSSKLPSFDSPLPSASPVEDPEPTSRKINNDPSLLNDPSEGSLLERREKSATPYPDPTFSNPSERLIPLPAIPARKEKRFKTDLPDDRKLREIVLPKNDVPLTSSPDPQPDHQFGHTEQFYGPNTLPLQSGTYFNSSRFQSLLPRGSGVDRPSSSASPISPGKNVGSRQDNSNPAFARPSRDRDSLSFRERLNSERWRFQHAHQLPTSNSSSSPMGEQTCQVPYQADDFAPIPYVLQPLDPQREIDTYYGKLAIDTQRPWVEWWRPFYTGGMYEPGVPVFSDVNLLTPSFLVYGDYRTGVGVHRNNGQPVRSWAHRLNLDMDLRLTGTERFHLFTGPLDHNGRFTRLDFSNNRVEFEEELDAQVDTAFFEGDLGAITGSWIGNDAPFDLPFTCGLVPLLYQNGIWMEDAIAGFAVGAPWRHNRALNWANYEATFFAGFNQVTSPAFQNDNNAAAVYGTAWFVEAYKGYVEMDYAYLDDLDEGDRSYHNAAIAYTRRYFGRISNSVRLIGNVGQSGPAVARSADGAVLLLENSLISAQPSTFVPYWNCFVGSGRPQSVARAVNAGGILRNTGINFETDGLTGYPTLNATASNSYGGAVGLNVLSADFRKQLVFEFAALDTYGDPALSASAGPEYALGTRYQTALNNRSIWRIDFMQGLLDNAPDIYGTRTEFRWKF